MSDDLEARAKQLVADYLSVGQVCAVFAWKATGAMKYMGPTMRTDQLLELLYDATHYFKGVMPFGERLQ